MYQKNLPQGITYEKLYQGQNIWFLTWVLKHRGCNPGFNQEILSAPFTVQREYRANGQLDHLISYKNGQRQGLSRGWYSNGQLQSENHWKNGQQHGLTRLWYRNGQLRWEGNWQNGQLHGLSRGWHPNGQLRWERDWQNGKKFDN